MEKLTPPKSSIRWSDPADYAPAMEFKYKDTMQIVLDAFRNACYPHGLDASGEEAGKDFSVHPIRMPDYNELFVAREIALMPSDTCEAFTLALEQANHPDIKIKSVLDVKRGLSAEGNTLGHVVQIYDDLYDNTYIATFFWGYATLDI